ncbi:hypothetical protein FB45DRAFT_1000023 [Roridomyces roridus]|uniref:Uncharacterized protein n=1 Tax=Roridomyces roridus TaxID=1738132 RepID=A0AAD7FSQ1_9AGAR|nr:hypothetical protein FB45DRAFT_1000023 [Roridomyces roridus]
MKFYTALSIALSVSWVLAHPIDTSPAIEPVDVDASHDKKTVPYHVWKPDSDDQPLNHRDRREHDGHVMADSEMPADAQDDAHVPKREQGHTELYWGHDGSAPRRAPAHAPFWDWKRDEHSIETGIKVAANALHNAETEEEQLQTRQDILDHFEIELSRPLRVDADASHDKKTIPYQGFFWKPDSAELVHTHLKSHPFNPRSQLSKRLQHLWGKPKLDNADGEGSEGVEKRVQNHAPFWDAYGTAD